MSLASCFWRDKSGIRPVFKIIIFFGLVYGIISSESACVWFFQHLFSIFNYMLGYAQLTGGDDYTDRGTIFIAYEFLPFLFYFSAALIATKIMALFEGRSFWSYNLGLFRCSKKLFFGFVFGVFSIIFILASLFLFGQYSFSKISFSFSFIFWDGLLSIGFNFLRACSFEVIFRGYIQKILNENYGFYFSLCMTTFIFSSAQVYQIFPQVNKENLIEALSYFGFYLLFGGLLCFSIRRTSSLWWSIGFHWGYYIFLSFLTNEFFVPNFSDDSLIRNRFVVLSGTLVQRHLIEATCIALLIFLMVIFTDKKENENGKLQ